MLLALPHGKKHVERCALSHARQNQVVAPSNGRGGMLKNTGCVKLGMLSRNIPLSGAVLGRPLLNPVAL